MKTLLIVLLAHLLLSCSSNESSEMLISENMQPEKTGNVDTIMANNKNTNEEEIIIENEMGKITSVIAKEVSISGAEDNYNFKVTLQSPDKGCSQYADWWEIINEKGSELIYRRVLLHSHVNEQPFTRSGGPVKIKSNEIIIVRGHMNNLGYGKMALKGSVSNGFKPIILDVDFGKELSGIAPLPSNCAF